jgi:hypothetical protein
MRRIGGQGRENNEGDPMGWICTQRLLVASLAVSVGAATTVALLPATKGRLQPLPMVSQISPVQPPGLAAATPDTAREQARRLTAYVAIILTPPVVRIENALSGADQAILAECWVPHSYNTTLQYCADPLLGDKELTLALARAAGMAWDAGHALALAEPPWLGPRGTASLMLVQEDLWLCGEELGALLAESAAAVQVSVVSRPSPVDVTYSPRAIALVALLSRAEAWLETTDHQTGAHARLPGFEPGGPRLDEQLKVQ